MTLQTSVALENARLDVIETSLGTFPLIELRSGSPPATPETADSGTLLAVIEPGSDWLAAAAARAKAINGTWPGFGVAGGTIGHFRLKGGPGSPATCQMQGTVTATGGGGDMTVDNVVVAEGQVVTMQTFTLTGGNA